MTTVIEKSPKPAASSPSARNVAADRVRFPTAHHIIALCKRGLLKTMRTPEALIDVTIQPVIFLLLFTYLFGGAMMGSTADYLQFLLPGIYVQSILFSSVAIGVNLSQDVAKGVTDRFRSLPISRSAPLIGAVTSDILRYLVLSASLLITGYIMGFRVETSVWGMLAAVALAIGFALCLCWVSVFVGMLARTPGAVQGILFLAIFPLTFGSNVFAQTNTMPGWLQAFVKVNPATSLADATRGLLSGGPVASPVLYCLLWMVGLLAVFFPLAVRAYRRRV